MSLNTAWAAIKSAVGAAPATVASATAKVEQATGNGVLRHLTAAKPHVPLIRFRAGQDHQQAATIPVAATASSSAALPTQNQAAPSGSLTYEWYDTPAKFRKRLIDEHELECINMGGAGMNWQ